MTTDPRDLPALTALTRFGLGAKPGDLKRIASDPRGAVKAELMTRDVALLPDPYLGTTKQLARSFLERQTLRTLRSGRELKGRRETVADMMRAEGRLPPETPKPVKAAPADGDMAGGMGMNDMGGGGNDGDKKGRARDKGASAKGVPAPPKSPLDDEIDARIVRARACGIGFVERWVSFWTNHFTVSSKGGNYVGWLWGAYDREAIRPHALGLFADLALAASRHSAMLVYLDLDDSRGPNSRQATNEKGKGFNENFARELLELHTVGVDGGYVQKDVTSLAYALTGWRAVRRPRADNLGGYEFDEDAHEPGAQTVMGTTYPDTGGEQGATIIADLARKPATARHVARRVAIAFVSDDPPPALVARLEKSFRDSDGDLKALALTLITSDEAWSAPRTKMRSPQEFVFAAARAVEKPDSELLITGLKVLGQPMWAAPSPKGYSIYGRDWIAPDAQTNRLDLAVDIAESHGPSTDPNALAADLLGDVMSDETKTAVKRAGSREQALALLLMSPEMQRR